MGLIEGLGRTFRVHAGDAYTKPRNILRQILCAPKVPAKNEDVSRVAYYIKCRGEKVQEAIVVVLTLEKRQNSQGEVHRAQGSQYSIF